MKKEQKSIARSIYENIEAKKGRLNEDIKNSYENGYYVNIDGYNVYSSHDLPHLPDNIRGAAYNKMEEYREEDMQKVRDIDSIKKDMKANRNVAALKGALEENDSKLPKVPSEVTEKIASYIPKEYLENAKLGTLNKRAYENQKKADEEYTVPPKPREEKGQEWQKYLIQRDAFKGIKKDSPAR